MVKPRVLLIGDANHREMWPVRESLLRLLPEGSLTNCDDVAVAAVLAERGGLSCDLILLCQLSPDQFALSDANLLFATFPLATVLCCFSTWCDSDGRNRAIWPPAVSVPAYAAAERIERELRRIKSGRPGLPPTASREETFAHVHGEPISPLLGRDVDGCVAVVSPDPHIRDSLIDALSAAGFRAESGDTATIDAAAVIFDCDPWNETAANTLREFRDRCPEVPILVVSGFPRPELIDEVLALGGDHIVPKLAPVTDLLKQLSSSLNPRPLLTG